VQLSLQLAGKTVAPGAADPTRWSRHLVWGSTLIRGGSITAAANAWALGVVWGESATPGGQPVTFGVVADSEGQWTLKPAAAVTAEREY
jgi:hypothetical protein